MTNKKLIEKLQEDMDMRGFSHYTKESYLRKTKEIIEYFGKPMKQVTTKELLGHSCIRSTMTYVHVANNMQKVDSPLDIFFKKKEEKIEC